MVDKQSINNESEEDWKGLLVASIIFFLLFYFDLFPNLSDLLPESYYGWMGLFFLIGLIYFLRTGKFPQDGFQDKLGEIADWAEKKQEEARKEQWKEE